MKSKPFPVFLSTRPALNLASIARELGMDEVNLRKIAIGNRDIPRARRGDFLRLMKKYGYEADFLPY